MATTKKSVKKTNSTKSTAKRSVKRGVVVAKAAPARKNDSVKYTDMFAAYSAFWRRGFTEWRGTSSRSEYWWSWVANALICALFVLLIAGSVFLGSVITTFIMAIAFLYVISAIIPAISMLTRRMHDAGLSAWFWLLYLTSFIPYIGSYVWSISILVIALLPTRRTVDNPYHKFNK